MNKAIRYLDRNAVKIIFASYISLLIAAIVLAAPIINSLMQSCGG